MRVKPLRTATARAITLASVCFLASAAVLVSAAQVRQAHGNAAFTPLPPTGFDHRSSDADADAGCDIAWSLTHDGIDDAARASVQPTTGANLVDAARDADRSQTARDANTSQVPRDYIGTASERRTWAESGLSERVARSLDPYSRLPEVTFFDRNSKQSVRCRLYAAGGVIDEDSALRLDLHLADKRDPKFPRVGRLDRRLLQLLFRVAYHFEVDTIEVVSAYREQGNRRRRREGLHGLARAIDFAVPGVKTEVLASYLRQQARVGVGIYTHRRTRFVHLDVRDQSYHWLDASPPRRTWRGVSIGNKTLPQRDAAYDARNDWPEGLPTPTDCRSRESGTRNDSFGDR